MRRCRAWAALILALACAHRPPPSLHTTQLVVRREGGAVVPYVRAFVAGHPLILVLDTGADRSILPFGFVQKYKVPIMSTTANPWMVDINGTVLSMPRASGVTVQFPGDTTFDTVDFLVNTADESEIRGILAGQDLVRSGWAMVVDLEHDELRYEPEEIALERLGGRDSLTKLEYRSCGFDNRRIIPVTINGVRSSLMIDTGASRTSLTRNNEAIPTM